MSSVLELSNEVVQTSSVSGKFTLGAFFITSAISIFFFVFLLYFPSSELIIIVSGVGGYAGAHLPSTLSALGAVLWMASAAGFMLTYKQGPLRP